MRAVVVEQQDVARRSRVAAEDVPGGDGEIRAFGQEREAPGTPAVALERYLRGGMLIGAVKG
jgi:hypothetical protein